MLAALRKEFGADRVVVAFKAFHEDVDSFGGIPYFDGGDGRISKATRANNPPWGNFCGCAKAPWTGAMIFKCSSMDEVDQTGEPCINIDAPPDVCAVIDDGYDRGRRPMHEALEGKRLFVCGLVTDFCVVDTCVNARAAGFTEVYLVPDASRAVHIHGIGQHGTGHLTDPKETVARSVAAGVRFTSLYQLLSEQQIEAALVPATSFPAELGPLGLLPACVAVSLVPGKDMYTIQPRATSFKEVVMLQTGSKGTDSAHGTISPRAPIPAGWPGASPTATHLCWAYPSEAKLDPISALGFANVSASPEQCFVAYGGFLHLDASGSVVAVQAVGAGDALTFGPARRMRDDFTKGLEVEGRLRPVTLPDLLRGGARRFCWIAPGEALKHGARTLVPSQTGAFMYTLADNHPPVYFQVRPTTASLGGRVMATCREADGKMVAVATLLAVGAVVVALLSREA